MHIGDFIPNCLFVRRCGHSKKRVELGIPLCDGTHKKLVKQ